MANTLTHTKLINIGNSKGIIIPKKMLDSINDRVTLRQEHHAIIIEQYQSKILPQEQWESRILSMQTKYDDKEFVDFDLTLKDGIDDGSSV